MRSRGYLLVSLVIVAACSSDEQKANGILIPRQSVWHYLDDGSEPEKDWSRSTAEVDWRQGRAELGFGDLGAGAEGTVIHNAGITAYFRHRFELATEARREIQGLRLSMRFDDGVVVYLNGQEVYRLGLGKDENRSQDVAIPALNEEFSHVWYCGPEALRVGTNVIAVEVHKDDVTDDDMSFDLELVAVKNDPLIWRGPYLQRGSPKEATLSFRTSIPVTPIVRFGESPTALTRRGTGPRGVEHSVVLRGLQPGTRYYYSIEAGDDHLAGGAKSWFRTHPMRGDAKPFRVWVLGDSGRGAGSDLEKVQRAYEDYSGARGTDVWLMLGDNAYQSGTDEEYQYALFDVLEEQLRSVFLWPVIGNHDARSFKTDGSGPYFTAFTLPTRGESGGAPSGAESYYSLDYANAHFVMLDTEVASLAENSEQRRWLIRDLEQNEASWTIVCAHTPPYTKGSHDSDTVPRHRRFREETVPLLERHGVDLVLSGHSHVYERSMSIHGHYGTTKTWDPERHLVRGGNGCPDDEAANECAGPPSAAYPEGGVVYVVLGVSSYPETPGTMDHPAMFVSKAGITGSMIIDIDKSRLEARFLQSDGTIGDRFVISRSKTDPN